ncbi:MAG: ABC transporter permease [Armatimonadota bacterium]
MSLAVLRSELSKLYRQRVTYASFGVILVLVALITWGSHRQRERLDISERIGAEFVVAGKTVTSLFVAQAVMDPALMVLAPVLVAVTAGALIAGERQLGTLRTLLTRPIPRLAVLVAKLIAGWSWAILLTLFLGLSALGLGYAVFGWGDLVIFRGGLTILEPHMGLIRLAEAYGLACASMCAVATWGLMLSAIFDNAMTAAGLTVAVFLVSGTVGAMPYFESIRHYLVTTHMTLYRDVLRTSIDYDGLWTSAQYLAAYTLAAAVIAGLAFARRDVTC